MAHFLGALTPMWKSCKERFFLGWQEFPFPDHPSGCSFSPKKVWSFATGAGKCLVETAAWWQFLQFSHFSPVGFITAGCNKVRHVNGELIFELPSGKHTKSY